MKHTYIKPILKRLALLLVLPCLTTQLWASHIVGGDISYTCLGNDMYEIKLRVYRDCYNALPGAIFDDPASVGIFDANNAFLQEIKMDFTGADTLNNELNDPCLFIPEDVCVDRTTYTKVVELPFLAGGYNLVYQRCCRNVTSPDFGPPAPIFICVNKNIAYDHVAVDPDGDELVYRMCTPLEGASVDASQPAPPNPPPFNEVTFIAPTFTEDNMLGFGEPLVINPQTGFLDGIPTVQGQYVVGVCVDEFRDGELISTVRRDFQYNVGICGEITASAAIPDAQCDNLTVFFDNTSFNLPEEFVWYFDWPDTTFKSYEDDPTFTYPDTGTYEIALIAEPTSVCSDTFYTEIFLQYNSLTPDFNVVLSECKDSTYVVVSDASVDNVSAPTQWNWTLTYDDETLISNLQNPQFVVPNETEFFVTLEVSSVNGCIQSMGEAYFAGGLYPGDAIDDAVSICEGGSLTLNPNGADFGDYEYHWMPEALFDDPFAVNPTMTPTESVIVTVEITSPLDLCVSEEVVVVDVTGAPTIAFDYAVNCDGYTVDFTNMSAGNATYQWNFDGLGTSTDVNPSFVFPDFGTYQVTLSSGATEFCQAQMTLEVVVPERILTAGFDFAYAECGESDITIDFTNNSVNSLNNTAGYTWDFGGQGTSNDTNPSFIATQEGPLVVTLTIMTNEGCENTISQTIDVDFIETDFLPSKGSLLICQNESIELNPNFDPNYTYQWSNAATLNDASTANPIASPLATTTYQVTISNTAEGGVCTSVTEVEVEVAAPIGLIASEDVITCEPNVDLEASAVELVDIAWTNEAGQTISDDFNLNVNVSGLDIYYIEVTDIYGCTEMDTVLVTGGPVAIETAADQVICTDDLIDVSVTNLDTNDDLSYAWSTSTGNLLSGFNTANPEVANTPGIATYYVTATSQVGCIAQDSVEVIIVDENIDLSFTTEIECNGATVNFTNTSSNAFDYIWDFGDPNTINDTSTEVNPNYTYTEVGTYIATLYIQHEADCIDIFTQEIQILEPELVADFSYEYLSCNQDSIVIAFTDISTNFQDNTNAWNWTFSNGQTSTEQNPVITIYEDTQLEVTYMISTPNNCDASITETLNVDFIETDGLPANYTICIGESVALNPNSDPTYAYDWAPNNGTLDDVNAANPIANPTNTTIYTVNIANSGADECSIQYEVTVFVPTPIELSATQDTFTCGSPIILMAEANSTVDFEWMTETGTTDGQILQVNPDGTFTYQVNATDNFGCEDSTMVQVVNQQVDFEGTGDLAICPDDELMISATNLDPNDVLNYTWVAGTGGTIVSGGNTNEPTIATDEMSVTFTVEATNQFGCVDTDEVVVTTFDFAPGESTNVFACMGIETPIDLGTDPNYMYEWSPITGLSDATIANPTVTTSEDITYTVTITNAFGQSECQATLMVNVIVYPDIELTASGDTTLCAAVDLDLTANSAVAVEYTWYNDDFITEIANEANTTVTPLGNETYTVVAEDEFGCRDTATTVVNSFPIDLFTLDGGYRICNGVEVLVSAFGDNPNQNVTYTWTTSNVTITNPNDIEIAVNPNETNTYYIMAENEYGCIETDSVTVEVFDINSTLEVLAEPDSILFGSGEFAQLDATFNPNWTYEWTPADGLDDPTIANPQATPEETTEYTLTVSDGICEEIRTVTVTVVNPDCAEPFVFLPTGFTPNGDGENDVLYVRGNSISDVYLVIYNRWGQKIFETNNINEGWDGSYKGKFLDPDAYGYYLQATCFNGEVFTKKGNITLLR